MDFFEGIESEKKELTPPTGFNVCYYDDWGKIGENLVLWEWFATYEEAEAYANKKREEGDKIYILGRRGKESENKTE